LGLALRFILDALKKNPNSKMYNFGITALDRFKHRLKDYHQYCSHISTIPHFQQFPQHLIEVCSFLKFLFGLNLLTFLKILQIGHFIMTTHFSNYYY